MRWKYIFVALLFLLFISGCQPKPSAMPSPAPIPQTPGSPITPVTEQEIRPPTPPSNLIGNPISTDTVSLQWVDNANNEGGFKIYRDGIAIRTVVTNIVTYQDTGLEAGKTYYYDIRAYNDAGESGPSSCTVIMPNPPLNVTINYVGVKFDHDPFDIQGPGDIRLVLVVSDGKQTVQEIIPPGDGSYQLSDYETMELNQRVFHTPEVSDYLKIGIIAYDDDPESMVSDIIQSALPILGAMFGLPDVSGITTIFSQYQEMTGKPLFENKDDYIGYYEGYWGVDESWGIGQYSAVGTQDFRVWLSIWSDSQPTNISKPILTPDVTIENVDIPSAVDVGKNYTYHITLQNNEPNPISVILKIDSSVTGHVSSKSNTIPADSSLSVADSTIFKTAGTRVLTYSVIFNGIELDSTSKTIEAEVKEALSVNFEGWYVKGNKATTASMRDTVTVKLTLSGGDPGQYNARVRRDIMSATDETIKDASFTYDGILATKEITFLPPFATNESSTDGYHIDLMKDGSVVWTLTDAYPPRLRVIKPTINYSLNVSVSPNGAGIVSLNPSGGVYNSGTSVTLTATPSSGFQFAKWSGDASGTNPSIMIAMDSNKEVVANFALITEGPLSVTFDGWYVSGIKVTTTNKGSTVIARIVVSGGNAGQYKMRIRRDIVWADDQTVQELTFNYDGAESIREVSFIPPYATSEASTDGYHIDLIKDGVTIWTLVDAYPPRLRVTK